MLSGAFPRSRDKYSLRNSLAGGFNLFLRSVFSMFVCFLIQNRLALWLKPNSF